VTPKEVLYPLDKTEVSKEAQHGVAM
jgi:hypothetical protein